MDEPVYVTAARAALDEAQQRYNIVRNQATSDALKAAERAFYRAADTAHLAKVRAATARERAM